MNIKALFILYLLLIGSSCKAQDTERVEFEWAYWDETGGTPQKGYAEIGHPDSTATNLRIIFHNDNEGDVGLIVDKGYDYKANLKVTSLRKQKFGPSYYLPQDRPTGIPELGLDRFWIKLDKKTNGNVTTVQVERRQSGRLMGRPRVILSRADDVMTLVAHAVKALNLHLLN